MKRIDYRPLPLSFFPPTRNLPSLCHTMPSLVWWRRKDRGRESLSQPSLPSRSILPSFSCPSGCHSPSPSQSALVFSFSIVTWKQLARESERESKRGEGREELALDWQALHHRQRPSPLQPAWHLGQREGWEEWRERLSADDDDDAVCRMLIW